MKKTYPIRWVISLGLVLSVASVVSVQSFSSNPGAHAASSSWREGPGAVSLRAAGRGWPWVNLRDGRELAASYADAPGFEQVMRHGLVRPRALASADFDEDGVPDLVSGYAGAGGGWVTLYRGNLDAIFPHSRPALAGKADGRFTPSAFLGPARVFALPGSPDFVGTGDFDNDGHWDVVAAARGGGALWLLAGDGEGRLGAARTIPLPGRVSSMTTGEINRADGLADVIVGVTGAAGAQVLVFESPEGALGGGGTRYSGPGRVRPVEGSARRPDLRSLAARLAAAEPHRPEVFAMPAEVAGLALGQLDGSFEMDLAVAAGEELVIVHGRDRRLSLDEDRQAEVGDAVIEEIGLGFEVVAVAIGDFIWDREHRAELAVSDDRGEVRLLARGSGGAGEPGGEEVAMSWELVDTFSLSDGLSLASAEASPVLVPARLSILPTDDLVVIDGVNHQLHILSATGGGRSGIEQPITPHASRLTTLASLDVSSAPVAVLPMRLNRDALSDLVVLRAGASAPTVTLMAAMATFTVNSTGDGGDSNPGDGMCDDGSGNCTLRAAIQEANANMGMDTIEFNIPGAGPHTISPTSALPEITDPVVIDGYAQPGAMMNTNPVGMGLNTVLQIELDATGVGHSNALDISAGSSTVRGLVINGFARLGIHLFSNGGDIVEGNFIGTDVAGKKGQGGSGDSVKIYSPTTIGGTAPPARNLISGNREEEGVSIETGATGTLVQGNLIGTDVTGKKALGNDEHGVDTDTGAMIGGTVAGAGNVISGNDGNGVEIDDGATGVLVQGNFIGTDVTGTADLGNGDYGVCIDESDNTIGGTAVGAGNIISGNDFAGMEILGARTLVQGNYIGTDVTGTAALGNNRVGVRIRVTGNNTIGGTAAGAGNVISGNDGDGVQISTTVVQGNFIGTNVHGTADLGNRLNGVVLQDNNNTIGGTDTGAGNTIAFNGNNGVSVLEFSNFQPTGNTINANSIHDNIGLGIDLKDDGVTANDPGDGDGGPNNQQNFPVLTSVASSGGTTTIEGTLDSTASRSFLIEFFANSQCDPSGFGEGETFLGSADVTTNGSGNASFMVTLSATVSSGQLVTATATDQDTGDTSEFSACQEATTVTAPIAGSATATALIAITEGSGAGSAAGAGSGRQALLVTDFDNDQVRVLLISEAGRIRRGPLALAGDGPTAIALGDVDGDGRTDAVIANQFSNDLTILLGQGDGRFQARAPLSVGKTPSAVVVGDFDGDGRVDIGVANFGENTVQVLKSRGNGRFQVVNTVRVGLNPTGLVTGDFDGDGQLDLAVSNFGSNDVTILRGNGRGRLRPVQTVAVGEGPMGIVSGDLQGRGGLDLATVNFGSNDVTILQNERAGGGEKRAGTGGEPGPGGPLPAAAEAGAHFSFARRRLVGEGPVALVAGEILTGRLGLAVANRASGGVTLWLGDESLPANRRQSLVATPTPVALTLGDLNRDGRMDLVVLDADGSTARVLLDRGDGTFERAPSGGLE